MISISQCKYCGKEIIPARKKCPRCQNSLATIRLPANGTVISCVTVHVPPEGFGPEPYKIAFVNIEGSKANLLCRTQIFKVDVGDRVALEKRGKDWVIIAIR